MLKILKNTNMKSFHKNMSPLVNPSMPTKKKSRRPYLIKRILITNGLSLLVVILTYLWMVFFLSSVGSFWDLFRGKDVYVNEDKLPPVPPFLSSIPEATQSSSIDITGKSEQGVKVELYIDGSRISETVSDSNGSFVFSGIPVGVFRQEIYTKAVDESGNTSNQSNIYTTQQDTTPPEVEITSPNKEELSYRATEHAYRVAGKTEPGAAILINGQLAVINPEGDFFANLRLEEGGNTIKILVKDKALNETEKEVYINFEKIN